MKNRLLIWSAAVLLTGLCSCGRQAEKTVLKGTLEGVDSVYVQIQSMDLQAAVPVTDGSFSYDCPVDQTAVGELATEDGSLDLQFIPDGSTLTLDKDAEGTYRLVSDRTDSPNTLLTEFYAILNPKLKALREKAEAWQASGEGYESKLLAEALALKEEITTEARKLILDNPVSAAILPLLEKYRPFSEEHEAAFKTFVREKMAAPLRKNAFVRSEMSRMTALEDTEEGKMFTDFTVADSDGRSVSLSDYVGKGKYVLVDFWASWCGPCRREIPNLIAVYDKYKGDDFNVLGVAVWDKPEDSKKMAETLGIHYDTIVNAGEEPGKLYGITGIPHIILFGPDGTILKRDLRGEAIEAEVAKYVSPAK